MNIGWPEGIILAMYAINLILTAILDGEPRTGTHKFSTALCGAMLGLGTLYWGGFFA